VPRLYPTPTYVTGPHSRTARGVWLGTRPGSHSLPAPRSTSAYASARRPSLLNPTISNHTRRRPHLGPASQAGRGFSTPNTTGACAFRSTPPFGGAISQRASYSWHRLIRLTASHPWYSVRTAATSPFASVVGDDSACLLSDAPKVEDGRRCGDLLISWVQSDGPSRGPRMTLRVDLGAGRSENLAVGRTTHEPFGCGPVDVGRGRVLRSWPHPTKGEDSTPPRALPRAETIFLIRDLFRELLRAACRDMYRFLLRKYFSSHATEIGRCDTRGANEVRTPDIFVVADLSRGDVTAV